MAEPHARKAPKGGGGQPGNKNNPKGRPGAKNKKTVEREKAVATLEEKLRNAGITQMDIDAVGLMQLVYRCPDFPINLRLSCADKAAPYERPRLAAVMTNIDPNTGQAVQQPPPPSLFVDTGNGSTVMGGLGDGEVTDLETDEDLAAMDKAAEGKPRAEAAE